jgi:hypothetical protein
VIVAFGRRQMRRSSRMFQPTSLVHHNPKPK